MISFTQNIISIDENQANICWIVENHSPNVIKDAVAYSNLFCHNFGEIGIDSVKSISFSIPLSKTGLLNEAFMNYSLGFESGMIKSESLRNFQ